MSEQANMAARYERENPEGYEARIEGNKVIIEPKESEDERIRKQLIGFLSGRYALCKINTKDAIAYLERQKERGPLSKDEEYTLARIIEYLEDNDCPSEWKDLLYDVYSLPYQKEQKPANSEKPKEWSEKDKLHLNNAILVAKKEWGVNSYTARWLESLRDNYKKCNSHWKPSEEQMLALGGVLDYLEESDNEGADIIRELINNLKKL